MIHQIQYLSKPIFQLKVFFRLQFQKLNLLLISNFIKEVEFLNLKIGNTKVKIFGLKQLTF